MNRLSMRRVHAVSAYAKAVIIAAARSADTPDLEEEAGQVGSYTITVHTDGGAETTVSVQDTNGTPLVTEVVVRAAKGQGLTAEQVPFVRLDLLLQALCPQPPAATSTVAAPRQGPEPDTGHGQSSGPVRVAVTRMYRRIPPDLAEVYAKLGSVTAVASHYEVPRHTAQGWIGRLRQSRTGTTPAATGL